MYHLNILYCVFVYVDSKISMPKTLKCQHKYKCLELACGKLICGDKWNGHCKRDHGFKLVRGHDIKRALFAVKEGDGPWRPFHGCPQPPHPTGSSAEVSMSVCNAHVNY